MMIYWKNVAIIHKVYTVDKNGQHLNIQGQLPKGRSYMVFLEYHDMTLILGVFNQGLQNNMFENKEKITFETKLLL